MKVLFINDVCHDTLFQLDGGEKVWFSEMSKAQRDEANLLFRPMPASEQPNVAMKNAVELVLRALLVLHLDPSKEIYVKKGNIQNYGVARYVVYTDVVQMVEQILVSDGAEQKVSLRPKTVGVICRQDLMMPVFRTMTGWAVILDDKKLQSLRSTLGL